MINNSLYTAQTLKDRLVGERNEPISDETVRYAINGLISLIDSVRWENDKAAMRKRSDLLSIDASGYDLTQIEDLSEVEAGFQVLENGDKRTPLKNVGGSSLEKGYFVEGETLYLNKANSAVIVYMKSHVPLLEDDDMSTFQLPFPRRLDEACYKYLMEIFYDGSFEFDKRNDARNMFVQEIRRIFTNKKRVDII